jgi:glycosyltransferase involved in cell wall biosynthesis
MAPPSPSAFDAAPPAPAAGGPRRIDLVFPVLPPRFDGIGDHTARLACALAGRGHRVRVLTAQDDWAPIDGVAVERAFQLPPLSGVRHLLGAVRRDPPDLLFLQFNQFSYGRLGFNPVLPWTVRRIKRALPRTRIAWMAHEEFVPPTSLKRRLMRTWQRGQFWALGRAADVIALSTSSWVGKFRPWFPGTPMHHLPVGSNIPRAPMTRHAARRRLGLVDDCFVLGYFGSIRGSRHLAPVREALGRLHRASGGRALLLYIGHHGADLARSLDGLPMRDAGPLPAEEVSRHFSAMDLYLAPFVEGVSTRRGSFMAALQHGLPVVATRGAQTDAVFLDHDGRALDLAPETDAAAFAGAAERLFRTPGRRQGLARAGRALYDARFDWAVLARTVETFLPSTAPPSFPDATPPSS